MVLVGRLMHKDREKDRDLGLNGVCLSWRADVAPNKSEVDPEGKASGAIFSGLTTRTIPDQRRRGPRDLPAARGTDPAQWRDR
jgi:hypothetical protein